MNTYQQQTPKPPEPKRRRFLKAWGKRRVALRRDFLSEACRSNLKVYGPGWIMPMWPLYLIAMKRGWSYDRWYEFAERAADARAIARGYLP
jgi:hypothetical protein